MRKIAKQLTELIGNTPLLKANNFIEDSNIFLFVLFIK